MTRGARQLPRLAITGPDGAGKSTTARMVALQIGQDFRLIQPGPSRPVYAVVNREIQYPFQSLIQLIHRLHGLADRTRRPALVGAVNALNVLLCARVVEPILIRRFDPELILRGRDPRVDPSVYSSVYLPIFARQPMEKRIDSLGRLTGLPCSDVIFFLTVPPDEAIRRIEARIVLEKGDPSIISATRSWRWRHIHEDPDTLAFLQSEFYRGFDALLRRWPVQIYEIDTFCMPQAQVVDFIVSTIREHMCTGLTAAKSRRWVRHSLAGTTERPVD